MAQTAVEWLKNRLPSLFEHDHDDFYKIIFDQAKQMEKEQIIEFANKYAESDSFYCNGEFDIVKGAEQYYNETYGK